MQTTISKGSSWSEWTALFTDASTEALLCSAPARPRTQRIHRSVDLRAAVLHTQGPVEAQLVPPGLRLRHRNIQPIQNFLEQAEKGTLPAVSWIAPSGDVSEHPPALVSSRQTYVTTLINTVMRSKNWKDSVIFLAWDDWGGFYDRVVPVRVDKNGYGLRVPGIVISPYAKRGFIDHQTLSFDAYVKFIEDDFLYGQRLDPSNDGRPDPRPDVRENAPELGDLSNDFDFDQPRRKPLVLSEHPQTDFIP
jgi:hypothetical protein